MSTIKNLLGLNQTTEFGVESLKDEWDFCIESTDDEIEGGVSDADVLAEATDELETATASLEALHEMINSALANGGLTKDSIPFVQLSADAIIGKYAPLVKDETTFPGMESFAESGDRMQASCEAMESVKQKIKSIWESIKAFIIKWATKVAEFYNTYNSWAKVQLALLERLAAKAKLAKSGEGKTIKLSIKEYQYLSEDGKFNKSVIIGGLTTLAALITESTGESELGKKLIAQSQSVKEGSEEVITPLSVKAAAEIISSSIRALDFKMEQTHISDPEDIVLISRHLLGNKHVKAVIEGIYKGAITKKVSITLVDGTKNLGNDIEAFSPGDVQEILGAAVGALKAVISAQSAGKEKSALLKQYVAANDILVKGLKGDSTNLSWPKQIINGTASTARAIVEPSFALISLTQKVVSSVKNLALKSLKSTGVDKPVKKSKEDKSKTDDTEDKE